MTERCYFAHPVTDYDTDREAAAVAVIEQHGFTVENPNTPAHNDAYKKRGMEHFVDVVEGCDTLAFQRFENGAIGAGIHKELTAAALRGLKLFEVQDDDLISVSDLDLVEGPVLTVDQTRELLRMIRNSRSR